MRAQSARAKKIKRFCRKFFIAPAVRSLEAESQFLCGLSKRPCEGPGRGVHAVSTGSSNRASVCGRGLPVNRTVKRRERRAPASYCAIVLVFHWIFLARGRSEEHTSELQS